MIRGSCLCGAVAFEVDGRVTPIQLCHAHRCQKSTGSAFSPELPGVLDDDPGTRPFRHILLGQGAAWHSVNDELPKFAGRPPPEQRLRRRD